MDVWHVYLVRCADGTLYTGMTNDLKTRLEKHNAGTGAKYTRSRRPVVLVWSRRVLSEREAKKREAEIKGWSRTKKEDLLASL